MIKLLPFTCTLTDPSDGLVFSEALTLHNTAAAIILRPLWKLTQTKFGPALLPICVGHDGNLSGARYENMNRTWMTFDIYFLNHPASLKTCIHAFISFLTSGLDPHSPKSS